MPAVAEIEFVRKIILPYVVDAETELKFESTHAV